VGARGGWREARQGAVTSLAGRGCCGSKWYTRRRPLQTQSSRSLVGRGPLRQPAASHADRARSVGGVFFCSRRLPPRGSNRLRCSRAGSCSTRRGPSVCCFQRTRRWESTKKVAPLPCKSPPLSGTAQQAQKRISSPLRGNGRGAGVSAGQSSCEGMGRVPRLSPVDGAHVPEQKSLRTHLYGGSCDQINLLRSPTLAALARGTGRVRMVGAGDPDRCAGCPSRRAAHSDFILACTFCSPGGSK